MRKRFFILKVLPFSIIIFLILLIKNDIYYLNDEETNSTIIITDFKLQSSPQTSELNNENSVYDVFDKLKNKFKKRAYLPENVNQKKLINNLYLTTLNVNKYGHLCNQSNNSKILIGLMSKNNQFIKRNLIRNTIKKHVINSNQKLLFFIAKSINETENELINEESLKYNDLIRLEFIDDYYNLTLKTISFLNYFNKYCTNFKYAIKLDDDVIFNWAGTKSYLINDIKNQRPTLYCYVHRNAKVNRDISNKWYVDKEMYSNSVFPNYCSGVLYAMNTEAVDLILKSHEKRKNDILFLEDVYTTGILTNATEIKLINSIKLTYKYKKNRFIKNYFNRTMIMMHPIEELFYKRIFNDINRIYNL